MKKQFVFLAALLISLLSSCESKKKAILTTRQQDSIVSVVKNLNDSSWANRFRPTKKSFDWIHQAITISNGRPFLYPEYCRARLCLASSLRTTFKFSEALQILKNLIPLVNIDDGLQGEINTETGHLLIDQKLPAKASEYYKKAALCFERDGDFASASSQYNNIANCYLFQNNYADAIFFLEKALKIASQLNQKDRLRKFLGSLGEVYQKKGDLKECLVYFKKSIALQGAEIDVKSDASICLNAAIASIKIADLSSAVNYLNRSKSAVRTFDDGELNSKYFECLYLYNKAIGQYENAVQYLEQKSRVDQEIKSKEILNQINEIETLEKIKFVESENEKKIKIIQLQEQQKATILVLLILFVVAIAIIILLVLIRKNKINQELRLQQQLIESQNSKILEQSTRLTDTNEQLHTSMEELKATHEQLIYAEKMASLGELTAGLAHEINNPLNFISGGIQALNNLQLEIIEQRETLTKEEIIERDEDIRNLLKSITNGIQRAETIIKSLTAFSNSAQSISDDGIDIIECLETSLMILNRQLNDKHITVVKHFEVAAQIKGNFSQINQVFVNTILNAIQASRPIDDPTITIELSLAENNFIIKIRDNGSGIPTEVQSKIMNPFFTTREVGKGAGLGLSISYGIIRNHKGNLTFSSTPGEGTEFVICLPA